MNLTYDEYQKRLETKKAEKAAEHRPQLQMLAQAEIKARNLTGDPIWDLFLSYLQAFLETTEDQQRAFESALTDSKTVDHAGILVAKIGAAECKSRVETLEAVISLPKDLIEMGQEATALLERME